MRNRGLIERGQGQGRSTCVKERRLHQVVSQRLIMTKNMSGPFWYIDTNAGCGRNERAVCDGSPLVFLAAARRVGRPFRAFFVEKRKALADELVSRLPDDQRGHVAVYAEDNRRAIPRILDLLPSPDACGLLYCDPNGYASDKGYPHEQILEFARRTSRVDLLLSLNATAARKIEGCFNKRPDLNMPDLKRMYAELKAARRHFIVAPPVKVAGHSFLQLLLTNCDKGLSGWREFISCEDLRAEEVLTYKQCVVPDQMELFS